MEEAKTVQQFADEYKGIASINPEARKRLLDELPDSFRIQVIENLVETAMRAGMLDVFDIRKWLGYTLQVNTVTKYKSKIKKRWLDETSSIAESAALERVNQIKRAWENIRECEIMYEEAKSVGDKVKVKQLELQWMQYIGRLNFIEQVIETDTTGTQVNIIAGSFHKAEEKEEKDGH